MWILQHKVSYKNTLIYLGDGHARKQRLLIYQQVQLYMTISWIIFNSREDGVEINIAITMYWWKIPKSVYDNDRDGRANFAIR